ncbi:MAG TPA: alpha/beta fold hydrolase [Pseudonocardia sp.]|jgi:3-oxoadipate enol-lactonase|uniref:alpha/beta fold hydrolase n=1 Tax=Pseudonocardia sp. TaxID=60912 RepID=UPI002B4AE1A6|nr:alpha/beta fold hydrolase [Pseudonocardia sp.]HLU56662.1 alpha/beta fold hydrolase [Pseudonocardia sp.]
MTGEQLVVFLHALGAWPDSWEHQIRSLPDGFAGIAPPIPGVAEAGQGPYDLAAAARGLLTVLDEHGAERAHLCGLSLGAMVATHLALDHPHRVASLVLSGSQVAPNPAVMAVQRTVVRLLPRRVATGLGLTKAGWLAVLRAVADTDFRPRLHEIAVPALVLCGSRDVANLPAARQLAAAIPGAELQVIRGAGHTWNVQMPDRFSAVVGDFYRRLARA